LGPIDVNAYYGEPGIDYYSHIKGILNMWGSLFVPYSYRTHPTDFFSDNTNNAPVISFHGFNDNVFNYIFQPVIFSTNASNNTDVNCLINGPLILNGGGSAAEYDLGSKGIFDYILTPLHIFRELYLDCSMAHGLDKCDDMDPLTPYCSEFGIGTDKNSNEVLSYIVQRACTFFQAIMGGVSATLEASAPNHKVFIECPNNRNKCSLANNDCGDNPDVPCTNESQYNNLHCVTNATNCITTLDW
jgi:hypothetical protein